MVGDDREFLDFFADEFWSLRRVGFLLTGDWGEAEELAQEAMARTFAAWPRVRGDDHPAAFARRVLLNRHRSLLRRALVEARHLLASRPACRPDQWRLASPFGLSGSSAPHRIFFTGIVRYRGGPACHLRLPLRMTVERDGRALPVTGSPSTATVEGLLPDDDQRRLARLGVHDTPLMWEFAVEEWCNRDLAGATLRVTAEDGRQVEQALPGPSRLQRRQDCRDRGRPAAVAGLP